MKNIVFLSCLLAACGLFAAPIDIGKPRGGTAGAETIQIDGKNAVRLTSTAEMPDNLRIQRNFGLKLKPNTPYIISFDMRTENIVPRPTKGMKGAGLYLVSSGKLAYRGSYRGKWRYVTGSTDWTNFEYRFKTGDDGVCYIYFELTEATGMAQFANLDVRENVKKIFTVEEVAENRFNFSGAINVNGQNQVVSIDGKPVLQCVTDTHNRLSYRQYFFKVTPQKEYKLSFYFRGKNIVPLDGKSLKGAGISITADGKIIYRGSDQGRWKHHLGTFDWTKFELTFKAGKSDTVSITPELTDATGTAEFSDLQLTAATPAQKKAAPQLTAELFPVDFQKGVYYMARNFPQTLSFVLRAPQIPKAPILELELPEGVECIAASSIWPIDTTQQPWQYVSDLPQKTAITRDGKPYTRNTLVIGPQVIRNFRLWRNEYRVYIRSAKAAGKAYWRLRDGNFTGEYKVIDLRDAGNIVYPKKKLSKFHLTMMTQMNLTGGYPEVMDAYDNFWRSLDEKPRLQIWHASWPNLPQNLRDRFSKNYAIGVGMSILGSTPRFGFSAWLKKNGLPHNYRLIEPRSSKETNDHLCPEEVISDPGNIIWDRYAPEGIRKYCAGTKPYYVDVDFEPGAMSYCFCEVCRAKFSTPIMSKDEILAKHGKAWFEFRVKQHAEVAKKFYNMVRKHFPDALPSMCTDPLHLGSNPLAQWCGVDPRLTDKDGVGLYQNMPYFEGVDYFDSIEFNLRELPGAPHSPLIDPTENSERYYNRYTPDGVATLMIAAASLGCIGQGFYPTDYFDGRYLVAIARSADLIAQAENFYRSGKRADGKVKFTVLNSARYNFKDNEMDVTVESPDFRPTIRSTTHEYDGKLLLTLFNYHAHNEMIAELTAPDEFYGRELNSNRILSAKNRVKIPSGGVALIEFSRSRPDLMPLPDFESELANFKSSKPVGEYGIVMPEKMVMPKVGNLNSTIYIRSERNANICSWKFASGADPLLHQERGFLGDFIAYPQLANRDLTYKITKPGVFEYQVPPPNDANPEPDPCEGLIIRKKYTISADGKEICAEFEVENANPRKTTMKLAPRLRNIPKVGSALAGKQPLTSITRINGNLPAAMTEQQPLDSKGVEVKVSDGSRTSAMVIMPDDSFKKFFVWQDSNDLYTVEFLPEPFELPAGQKKKFYCRFRTVN